MTTTTRRAVSLLAIALFIMQFAPQAHAQSTSAPDLTIGSRNADVTLLQTTIIAANSGAASQALASVGATGYFGALTRSALAEYQAMHGIVPAAGYYGPLTRAYMASHPFSTTIGTTTNPDTFTGTILAVETGCFTDGTCSVTVGGKKVILVMGMRLGVIPEVGTLTGVDSIGDLEGKIGSQAQVYATTTPQTGYNYTLYGSNDFYVKVLSKDVAGTPITVRGTIGCLPPKDPSQPTIALCAYSIHTATDKYYALQSSDPTYADVSSIEGGSTIEVTGTLTPTVMQTSFKGDGTIAITSIRKVS